MIEHQSSEKVFIVDETKESFIDWLNRPYISPTFRSHLAKANLLIVPREGFRGQTEPVFPVGTEELFNFLKDNSSKGLVPEICIEDKDYKELALHGALLIIGSFLVTAILAPVVADLISEYMKKRLRSKKNNANIKVELTVIEDNGRATRLLYEGPAVEFRQTIIPAIDSLGQGTSETPPLPHADKTKKLPPR